MNDHSTGVCPYVSRSDAPRLKATRETNYPSYENSLKEHYRTRRREAGGRQSRKSGGKDHAHVNYLVLKLNEVQPSRIPAVIYSQIPQPADNARTARRIDSSQSQDEAHVDSVASSRHTHKRARFSEAILGHPPPTPSAQNTCLSTLTSTCMWPHCRTNVKWNHMYSYQPSSVRTSRNYSLRKH